MRGKRLNKTFWIKFWQLNTCIKLCHSSNKNLQFIYKLIIKCLTTDRLHTTPSLRDEPLNIWEGGGLGQIQKKKFAHAENTGEKYRAQQTYWKKKSSKLFFIAIVQIPDNVLAKISSTVHIALLKERFQKIYLLNIK